MKKAFVLFTGMMLGLMSFSSCSHSESDGHESDRHIVNCDIADAKSLVVLPRGELTVRAVSSGSSEILYKIDTNGNLKPVKGMDDSGREVEVPAPTEIIDVNADWLILNYSSLDVSYFINKEKGNTYVLTEQPALLSANSGYLGFTRKSVFTDESGNLYFVALFSGLCKKLNVSDENKVTISTYTPDSYRITGEFCVDSTGNVLFSYYDGTQREAMKIKTAAGALKNLDSDRASGGCTYSFAGYDGALYCDGFRYTIENNELIKESYGLTESDFSGLGNRGGGSQGLIWFYFDDSIWVTDRSMNTYAELYNTNPSKQPSVKPVPELANTTVSAVAQNATSIFAVTTNGIIYKFDVADGSVSKVFENGNYEIHTFSVTDEGLIQFSALNLQNSHKILATVGADGKVTVLGDNLEDDVKILQRIR